LPTSASYQPILPLLKHFNLLIAPPPERHQTAAIINHRLPSVQTQSPTFIQSPPFPSIISFLVLLSFRLSRPTSIPYITIRTAARLSHYYPCRDNCHLSTTAHQDSTLTQSVPSTTHSISQSHHAFASQRINTTAFYRELRDLFLSSLQDEGKQLPSPPYLYAFFIYSPAHYSIYQYKTSRR
jgi:hypothetical protein